MAFLRTATLVLAFASFANATTSAQDLLVYNVETSDGPFSYWFTHKGVVVRSQNMDPATTAIGLWRFDNSTKLNYICWIKLQKPLAVANTEAVRVDASQSPPKFQIVEHSIKKRVNTVTKVTFQKLPPTDARTQLMHRTADQALALVKANAEWQQGLQRQQLELMLEFQKGMSRAGWNYVEKFGSKLGL